MNSHFKKFSAILTEVSLCHFQAIPLIERLALHELIDPRIGDSYDTFEVYHMARTAFLCVQNDPELRPSMGEVNFVLDEVYLLINCSFIEEH